MESAASTDPARPGSSAYELTSHARVRSEPFGLLFYDRRGPRLFFLASRDWVSPEFFDSRITLNEWSAQRAVPAMAVEALERAMIDLEVKGVVRAVGPRA
ncbi:MAG: mycofactocin biosynthesis chaperone MftB [Pseudomonadota bacterium]